MKHYILIAIAFFSCFVVKAQTENISIAVNGTVNGRDVTLPVTGLMVVNKRTGLGSFGATENTFSVTIQKNDTLLITSSGYAVKKISFKDSTFRETYSITVLLDKPTVTLKPVTIISHREIEQIQQDIEKLGYKKEDYMLTGVDAFQSPITFLYQAFSKRERVKREIAEKRNEDAKRKLLKELFQKYIDNQIMDLSEEEFDSFIDFINVNDDFLKNSSQYDFIIYVKRKFEMYRSLKK